MHVPYRIETFVEETTGNQYILVVVDETPLGWRVEVNDRTGHHIESLDPLHAFMQVPPRIRGSMTLSLKKYQEAIALDKLHRIS